MINIFFDGGTALNSTCFYDENRDFYDVCKINKKHTNNELEYLALLKAMEYVIATYDSNDNFRFVGDSELIIRQANKEYKVNSTNLFYYYNKLSIRKNQLNEKIIKYVFDWTPRAYNKAGVKLENIKEAKQNE